jgi:hypothetical protein
MSDIRVGSLIGKLWITKMHKLPDETEEYFCECSCGAAGWLKLKHLSGPTAMRCCRRCSEGKQQIHEPFPRKRDPYPALHIDDFALARGPGPWATKGEK